MIHNTTQQIATGIVILFMTTSFLKADDSGVLTKLKVERAALAKRLTEVEAQIDKIEIGSGVHWFGMTLVDPTKELLNEYGLSADHPGPIMVKVQPSSSFPNGTAPTAGCAFWIVEHPAKGFFFNEDKSPSHFPTTVRALAEAILSCTATPDEYQNIYSQTAQKAREHAETLKDNPAERERMLKIADYKMPEEDVGKYICRVVYNYPGPKGTMTTYLRMTKADLDQIREFLKN
jgi:hypothetical protein